MSLEYLAASGRLGEVANGRFGAFHCEVIGGNLTAAIGKADRPQRVGSTYLLNEKAACRHDEGPNGSLLLDC